MKLVQYLQSEYQLARRKIVSCIQSWGVFVNGNQIENFKYELALGDHISIVDFTIDCIVNNVTKRESSLVLYHKPIWYTVSKDDPYNQTIYDILPKEMLSFQYIGRLDRNSSWLLLLTNDMHLVHQIGHPSADLIKKYELEIDMLINKEEWELLLDGLWVDENGNRLNKPADIQLAKEQWIDFLSLESFFQEEFPTYVKVTVLLKQWRKRHLRRLMKAIWKRVITLHRNSFGPYTLWTLKAGERSYITI